MGFLATALWNLDFKASKERKNRGGGLQLGGRGRGGL